MITSHGWFSFPFDMIPVVLQGDTVFASGYAEIEYTVDAPDPSVGVGAECEWKIDEVSYSISDIDGELLPCSTDNATIANLDDQVMKFLRAAQGDSISEQCHEDACW